MREIIHNRESVTVVVEEGQEVEIRPVGLEPLPELEGWDQNRWSRIINKDLEVVAAYLKRSDDFP